MSLPIRHERFTLDIAGPGDNDEICRLFRDVHIQGELDLNQERDPDFFALQRLHHDDALTLVARDRDGRAAAIGSIMLRPGWLDGCLVRTGYLGDLRVRPGFRGGVALAGCYDRVLAHVEERYGVKLLTTVVFDDNQVARKVLLGPGAARRGQPVYKPMTPFVMTSVQFTRQREAPARVQQAGPGDIDDLRAFLASQGQLRRLGEDFTGDLLQRRLADWPGLSLSDFLLVREAGAGSASPIVGCLAPWDSRSVKRTRVLGYHGRMLWVKRAFDLGARVLRYPPLPPPGDCFRFAFLTHLEVQGDDPTVLRDLLLAAYAQLYPRRLHFMSALVPVGSRLEAAFGGFMVQHTPMTLYAVCRRTSAYAQADLRTLHSGFELALS